MAVPMKHMCLGDDSVETGLYIDQDSEEEATWLKYHFN
jgi:hypothetical protein